MTKSHQTKAAKPLDKIEEEVAPLVAIAARFNLPEIVSVPLKDVRRVAAKDGYKVRDTDEGCDEMRDLVTWVLRNGATINPPNTRRQAKMSADVVWGGNHRLRAIEIANLIIQDVDLQAKYETLWATKFDETKFVEVITEIRVQRWDISSVDAHSLALAENVGIKEMSRLEKSQAIAAILARKGMTNKTVDELAEQMGVSAGTIRNLHLLGNLIPALQKAVFDRGTVPASVGYRAAELPPAEQKAFLEFLESDPKENSATKKIEAINKRKAELKDGAAPGGEGAEAAAALASAAAKKLTYGQIAEMVVDLIAGKKKVLRKMSVTEQSIRLDTLLEVLGRDRVPPVIHLEGGVKPRNEDGSIIEATVTL